MKTLRDFTLIPLAAVPQVVTVLRDEGWMVEAIYYSGLTGVASNLVGANGQIPNQAQTPIIAIMGSKVYNDEAGEPLPVMPGKQAAAPAGAVPGIGVPVNGKDLKPGKRR